jgi:hypothetical protein
MPIDIPPSSSRRSTDPHSTGFDEYDSDINSTRAPARTVVRPVSNSAFGPIRNRPPRNSQSRQAPYPLVSQNQAFREYQTRESVDQNTTSDSIPSEAELDELVRWGRDTAALPRTMPAIAAPDCSAHSGANPGIASSSARAHSVATPKPETSLEPVQNYPNNTRSRRPLPSQNQTYHSRYSSLVNTGPDTARFEPEVSALSRNCTATGVSEPTLPQPTKRLADTDSLAVSSKRSRIEAPPIDSRPTRSERHVARLREIAYLPGPSQAQLLFDHARLTPNERQQLQKEICASSQELVITSRQPLQVYLAMSARNVLAHRNGYGAALFFIGSHLSPAQNLSRLSIYLFHLSRGKPANTREKNTIREGVELAAHYLVKTDWFETGASPGMSMVANKLARFMDFKEFPATKLAMASLADQMTYLQPETRLAAKHFALLCNAFSKLSKHESGNEAISFLARYLIDEQCSLHSFDAQNFANILIGLSKWRDAECGAATRLIAQYLVAHPWKLDEFEAQHFANTFIGLSKWPDAECGAATRLIAQYLVAHPQKLDEFEALDFANTFIGLSKWPDAECGAATRLIAQYLVAHPQKLDKFDAQDFASTFIGFSKWRDEPDVEQAAIKMVSRIGKDRFRFSKFDMKGLAPVANALACWFKVAKDKQDQATEQLSLSRLQALGEHLVDTPSRIEQASALQIGLLLKSLGQARLHNPLKALGALAVARLHTLHAEDTFQKLNLETTGTLCAALLPLARSPALRQHRAAALTLLEHIHPAIVRKVNQFLQAQTPAGRVHLKKTAEPGEAWDTRKPAGSLYQILKAYSAVQGLWKPHNLRLGKTDARPGKILTERRRNEFDQWCTDTLKRSKEIIEGDLAEQSWNLIMEIESDSPVDALDSNMVNNTAQIHAQNPPSQYSLASALESMRHPPCSPLDQYGITTIPKVDIRGRAIANSAVEPRYTILGRLTGGGQPLAAVQLPGPPSVFMLNRAINIDGIPYRADLVGGSKMKSEGTRLEDLFARNPHAAEKVSRKYGSLIAFPYSDTAQGTPFANLVSKLFTYKESFYYFQRMMLASPPAIPGLGPTDHVLEGQFKVATLPDRPATVQHSFIMRNRNGQRIELKPHDGCGFIKLSVARQMPLHDKALTLFENKELPAYAERRMGALPAQATQHLPQNYAVLAENNALLKAALEQHPQADKVDGEALFRQVTTGQIEGKLAIVLASADNRIHFSSVKSSHIKDIEKGVIGGRSPYDKLNLRPFELSRISLAANQDPTALFLDECMTLQYTFVAAEDDPISTRERKSLEKAKMSGVKGIMMVVPDECWPEGFADRDMVHSAEDVKLHTDWAKDKNRARVDTRELRTGVWACTEVYPPGSANAVPVDEQKALDGDFDGDADLFFGDRPAFFAHVVEQLKVESAKALPSLKPGKTHTPAINEQGEYEFTRLPNILSASTKVMQDFSSLQALFVAQEPERQEWAAQRLVFGTYVGTAPELKRGLRALLGNEASASAPDVEAVLALAKKDVETTRHPIAKKVAALLLNALQAWRQDPTGMNEEHARLLRIDAQSGGANVNISPSSISLDIDITSLLSDFAAAYALAGNASERLTAILDQYPQLMEPIPDGYVHNDMRQTALNFLSLGIKVGTDSYKSSLNAASFGRKAHRIQTLIRHEDAPGELLPVLYTKATATQLNRGTFDAAHNIAANKNNPTLAAQLMAGAVETLIDAGRLVMPQWSRPNAISPPVDPAGDAANQHAEARVQEPAITSAVRQIVEICKAKLLDEDKTLKTVRSMTDQLQGLVESGKVRKTPVMALRYVLGLTEERFVKEYKNAIQHFEGIGFGKAQIRNSFIVNDALFMGISAVLESEDGYLFGVQFHTRSSYACKLQTHDLHKDLQALMRSENPDPVEVERIRSDIRKACAAVALPPNITEIQNFTDTLNEQLREFKTPSSAKIPTNTPGTSDKKQLRLRATLAEPVISLIVFSVAAKIGGQLRCQNKVGAELKPEDFLKSENAIGDKITRIAKQFQISKEEAKNQVYDTLQYAIELDFEKFANDFNLAIGELKKSNVKVEYINNAFDAGVSTYSGINCRFSYSDANNDHQLFEVQFHSSQSLEAKNKNHLAFKMMQTKMEQLEKATVAERQTQLTEQIFKLKRHMEKNCRDVSQPPNVQTIANFPNITEQAAGVYSSLQTVANFPVTGETPD